MRELRGVDGAGRSGARLRGLVLAIGAAVLGGTAAEAAPVGGAPPERVEEDGERGRSGMRERRMEAGKRLEAWLAERGEGASRVSPLGIDLPGWSFFRVSLPPEAGLEEPGETSRFHAVRDDGSVVTGHVEIELARLLATAVLGSGEPTAPLETLGRAVLVLAGRGATVVGEAEAAELARRHEGVAFAGPSLERTPAGTALVFQARTDAGPGRAPLSFLLVRASVGVSGEARLEVEERAVRSRRP